MAINFAYLSRTRSPRAAAARVGQQAGWWSTASRAAARSTAPHAASQCLRKSTTYYRFFSNINCRLLILLER